MFQSSVVLFRTDSEEILRTIPIGNALIYDLHFLPGNTLCVLCEDALYFYELDGQCLGSYAFEDAYLKDYTLDGNGFVTLVMNLYKAGNGYTALTVGYDGTVLGTLPISEQILDISASGKYLALLTSGALSIYDQNLTEYAVSDNTTGASSAVMREDDPFMNVSRYTPLEIETSEVRCPDAEASEAMKREIDRAIKDKDSLGGTFRVIVRGLLPGVGGYAVPTERLTSTIGGALFSIPAIKGVEFGMGFEAARKPGSQVHDPILLDRTKAEFTRASNNAGGLEGGMTTGMPLVVTAAMKPIPTLMQPLQTVNLDTLEVAQASKERSDVCAVPACAVVAEGEVAFAIADAYMRKFGSDNMADIKAAIKAYKQRLNTVSR